ncbi:META domain-containing protein [Sneathiella chinensis]|uniref:DUF306 domain-containing protein n=1 Tax=Sneathiella chinensis TaxID=349750 RepID=A0ABQ5U497_9PROT|nr:META domain-containing protein [Sneathiella chinensis]GLQ06734.1 hypothetical protein GCM10007924_19550 [Sneathiella chinensis]
MVNRNGLLATLLTAAVVVGCTPAGTDQGEKPGAVLAISQVTGEVAYRERIALAPSSRVGVSLYAISPDGSEAEVASNAFSTEGRQVPFPFSLDLTTEQGQAVSGYRVKARIEDAHGRVQWVGEKVLAVPSEAGKLDAGMVMLKRSVVRDGSAAAGGEGFQSYRCDGALVDTRMQGDKLELVMRGGKYLLSQEISASGARFVGPAADGEVEFWSKGDTATLTTGNKAGASCAKVATGPLGGGEWVVEDIASAGVIDNSRATLMFGEDGRLSGRASCNSYSTTFKQEGSRMTLGATATTMMACLPALSNQEAAFLKILGDVQNAYINETGALVLVASSGKTMTARR